MSTFEVAQPDPSKKKIEQSTQTAEASPENQTESSRTQKITRAFSETFRRIFQPEKFRTNKQEEQLRDELVSRGFLRQETALGMTNDELQYTLREVYVKKFDTIYDATENQQIEYEQKLEAQNFFGFDSRPNNLFAPEDFRFNYSGDSVDSQQQWTVARKQLDEKIPDEKLLQWERLKAMKIEKEREERFRQQLTNLWNGNKNKIDHKWKKHEEENARLSEEQEHQTKKQELQAETKKQTDFWETLRGDEETDLGKIESLCQKGNLSQEDVGSLQEWLHYHKEFGLEEMSDEEYNSFFQDGKFYVHSSSFFANKADIKTGRDDRYNPQFIEALKDGHLVGRNIAERRNEYITGSATPESLVFFNDQNNFLDLEEKKRLFGAERAPFLGHHLSYGDCNENYNIPVMLISPARLLENHSFRDPVNRYSQRIRTAPDGISFGSGNIDDPFDKKHNITLPLFTMLLPDIKKLSPELLQAIEENMESLTGQDNLSEISELKNAVKMAKESAREVSMKDLMSNLISILKKKDENVPRLYYYNFEKYASENFSGIKAMERGLFEFLDKNNIKIVPDKKERDFTSINPLGPEGYQEIPENYRVDRERMEKIANEVRRILKKQQIETAAKEESDRRQEAQSSEDLAVIEKTRNRLQSL